MVGLLFPIDAPSIRRTVKLRWTERASRGMQPSLLCWRQTREWLRQRRSQPRRRPLTQRLESAGEKVVEGCSHLRYTCKGLAAQFVGMQHYRRRFFCQCHGESFETWQVQLERNSSTRKGALAWIA